MRCGELAPHVQCGYGRPGTLFAFERAGITPDIVSSAKGIGGGFPLGATLVTEKIGSVLPAGSHGSTYGSNPLAMAVGNAVLDLMLEEGRFAHVTQMGKLLMEGLADIQTRYPDQIKGVRGVGLMIGLEPTHNARELASKLLTAGLTTSPTVTNVIRLVPPLIIDKTHVSEALGMIESAFQQ